MHEKSKSNKFKLHVPLDASGIEGFKPEQKVKVLTKDLKGKLHCKTVAFDEKGKGLAAFEFSEHPGSLHVVAGPADASDEELLGLQTLSFEVSGRLLTKEKHLKLPPVVIHPYYWYWWLRWCRKFTIRGRVVCPDGSPVPGAEVCAHDIDKWFTWSSTQVVGCATTDIDGAFEITFRWCCGWWPWWWLRNRIWQLDPLLTARVNDVLRRVPELRLSRMGNLPSLGVFNEILAEEGISTSQPLRASDVSALSHLRKLLLAELPAAPELESLQLWPWYPWQPWLDCTPDIIFKVTQDCETPGEVILDEGLGDTRWNIPNTLDVTLVAAENACCRPQPCQDPPCVGGECLIIDSVCRFPFDRIGGNPGAAATPPGYLYPGPVPVNTRGYHRPFAGIIPIWKNPGDLLGVDYYEIEFNDGSGWKPLPSGAAVDFVRRYWDTATSPPPKTAAFPFTDISGHNVAETREHYQDRPDTPATWDFRGAEAWWLSTNWNLLVPLDTTKFADGTSDGTYRFRVIGWQKSGGILVNRRVLPVCGAENDNEFVLTFDNRVTTAAASHDAAHNCGEGVHLCTTEPDTHITAVRIDGVSINPCDIADISPDGMLEIDFLAHDSDEHLAYYVIYSTWGLSMRRYLLGRPSANVTVISGGPTGWAPGQTSGNYGTAINQGAGAPHWAGGRFRLSIPMSEAFPDPCCYQLELWAFKRTVVGSRSGLRFTCDAGFRRAINGNKTEYSIGVGI